MTPESVIPPHLRRFVVNQNYAAYTEEDQAVWRFVVLQSHARLLRTAHPAYAAGFESAGISVDRIPRIDEMDERLSRFGWRAVPVDGFIPPRAFQAFQARSILPVATDIRSARHLTYTPAPDIIHEAAGHAPFLTEPHYASFVRRIGEAAESAFASPSDRVLYEAIFALSEIKEDPASTPSQVTRAELSIERAMRRMGPPSESAKLARLYWWTAEYGLVGALDNFRLYGAGLLSSLGEGYSCEATGVRKVPLGAGCIDTDYDITRVQPQLFVVRDLDALDEILDEVTMSLSFRIGGERALTAALESDDVSTLELDSGACVTGVVTEIERHAGKPSLIRLRGPCALADGGRVLDAMPRLDGYVIPLGTLDDGTPLSALSDGALARRTVGDVVELRLSSGLTVRGHLRARVTNGLIHLDEVTMLRHGEVLFRSILPYPLALGAHVITARARVPEGYYPSTGISSVAVPRPRPLNAQAGELAELYDRALETFREADGSRMAVRIERMVDRLDAAFPDDWLLRWNLLESLVKLGAGAHVTGRLAAALEQLEIRFDHLEPIATGLSYIRSLMTDAKPESRPTFGDAEDPGGSA